MLGRRGPKRKRETSLLQSIESGGEPASSLPVLPITAGVWSPPIDPSPPLPAIAQHGNGVEATTTGIDALLSLDLIPWHEWTFGAPSRPVSPPPPFGPHIESLVQTALCDPPSAAHLSSPFPEPDEVLRARLEYWFRELPVFVFALNRDELLAAFDNGLHRRHVRVCAVVLAMATMASSIPRTDSGVARSYIREAVRCNALIACEEAPTALMDVVTSLFLWTAWQTLGDHERAWMYLQEALSRAQACGLDGLHRSTETPSALRLRLLYWLVINERVYAFLRPTAKAHDQGLRIVGDPWNLTETYRSRLPPDALHGFPIHHTQVLSLADERVVACWLKRCQHCTTWTAESATSMQRQFGIHLDAALTGQSTLFDARVGGVTGETSNLVVSIAWLRK